MDTTQIDKKNNLVVYWATTYSFGQFYHLNLNLLSKIKIPGIIAIESTGGKVEWGGILCKQEYLEGGILKMRKCWGLEGF